MSSKVSSAAFLLILLVFCFSLSCAARPAPHHGHASPESVNEIEGMEVRCEAGDEECLMRRTLAAHLDYIYTQKHNP